MFQRDRADRLVKSNDMTPVQGTVEVDIPIEVLWESFSHANAWPGWNKCFFWAANRDLVQGQQLIWCFQPIRWWYLYKMPAIARIVEVEKYCKVTWEVVALPGFYARHTYHMEDLGNGRSRFGSWEQAMGWSFRLMKKFWVAHFVFVKDRSLEGARRLEAIYRRRGTLDEQDLPRKSYVPFFLSLLLWPLLIAVVIAYNFYRKYMRLNAVKLAPGVHAVLSGGGNSLVVQDGKEVLLVDTKFPPASKWLRNWISRNIGMPVTKIINTHYHYDHTYGNILYPEAQIIAHKNVPALMMEQEGDWWSSRQSSMPTVLLGDGSHHINIGKQKIKLTHPNLAHTHGDLWLDLPKQNIVATGDLLFHTYYSYFDLSKGGTVIPPLIKEVRNLADTHPTALFMPGHGPLAHARDLHRYADYLEFLYQSVEDAYKRGLSEEEAMKKIDLSPWNLSPLPSFHRGKLTWFTARANIRWVYQIIQRLFSRKTIKVR